MLFSKKQERRLYRFSYEFVDGSKHEVEAHTPGDARAALKKRLGKPLQKVVTKSRVWLNPPKKEEPANA